MTQYVSALELATYLDGTTELADLEPSWIAQADLLLEMISADVEAAAGIVIDSTTSVVAIPGTWSRDLELPSGPIQDITAVAVNGFELAAGSYWWNDRHILRRGTELTTVESEPLEPGRQGASNTDRLTWGGPISTITVAYTFGYDEIPPIVRSLTLRIAARTIGNVTDVSQESLAVYSVKYSASASADGSHVSPGERLRLRKILNRTSGTIEPASR